MRLTLSILGLELFDLNLTTVDEPSTEPGDSVSTAVGFAVSPGDQRWETGTDYS